MRRVFRVLLAVAMIFAGAMHFITPDWYVQIVPAYLPAPRALVFVSGVFEILGGAGVLIPRVRRVAAWGLVALLVAVFPANLNMATNHIVPNGGDAPTFLLWLRLPLQAVFIAWVIWVGKPDKPA